MVSDGIGNFKKGKVKNLFLTLTPTVSLREHYKAKYYLCKLRLKVKKFLKMATGDRNAKACSSCLMGFLGLPNAILLAELNERSRIGSAHL